MRGRIPDVPYVTGRDVVLRRDRDGAWRVAHGRSQSFLTPSPFHSVPSESIRLDSTQTRRDAPRQAGIITFSTSVIKGGVDKFALKQPIFLVRPRVPASTRSSSTTHRPSMLARARSRPRSTRCTRRSSCSRASAWTTVSSPACPFVAFHAFFKRLSFFFPLSLCVRVCPCARRDVRRRRRDAVQHGRVSAARVSS